MKPRESRLGLNSRIAWVLTRSQHELVSPFDKSGLCITVMESGRFRGSSRFLGLRSRAETRIPAPEGVLPLLVEHAGSYLQEEMCSTLAPSHLLFLHHSLAHDLIDRRLDETGSDPFPVAIALPVVRHELLIAVDVGV